MIKLIQGNKALLEELMINLFGVVCINQETGEIEGVEINGSDADGYAIKIDTDMINDVQMMIIEAGMFSRIQAGVLSSELWTVDEAKLKNSFSLIASSAEKLDIILKDILRGAKVPTENTVLLQQPFAPGMYSTLTDVVIAFNLNDDQMKAVELSTKVAQTGIKVTNFTKKASMVAGTSANVLNRVGKEVTLATVEVGATVGVGAIKTGVEATACVANIAIRDLNHKELMKGDNVQTLMKTVKGLWGQKTSTTVQRGFGAL